VVERVMVEVGGFSSGVYHTTRLIKYDEAWDSVRAEAEAAFRGEHGEPSEFGQYGFSTSAQDVPPPRSYRRGFWTKRKKYIDVEGYTTAAGIRKRGHRRRAWVRVWVPERIGRAEYEPELRHATDTERDTRGGERRRRR